MSALVEYLQRTKGPSLHGDGRAWWPTTDLAGNLEVFKALVWRDYLDPEVLAIADQLRSGDHTTWDPATACISIWDYVAGFRYIAPPAGEELYLPFKEFMRRQGGDCDNKTLVSCCLMLASGIRCRAVVIEIPLPNGEHSGEGHMYPEAFIPERGWVAFDPSRRDTSPWQPDHAVPGWRVAEVDFTGLRPTEAQMNSVIPTRGRLAPAAPGFGGTAGLYATARLMTGMLTGASVCGPEPTDPTNPDQLALHTAWYACTQREQAQPGYWETVADRAQRVAGEGILGAFGRKLRDWGLAPAPTGGATDLVPVLVAGGLIVGGILIWKRMKRAA